MRSGPSIAVLLVGLGVIWVFLILINMGRSGGGLSAGAVVLPAGPGASAAPAAAEVDLGPERFPSRTRLAVSAILVRSHDARRASGSKLPPVESSGVLEGQLVDATGRPVAVGKVTLRRYESPLDRVLRERSLSGPTRMACPTPETRLARVGPQGAFLFDDLAPGEYALEGYAPGHERIHQGPLRVDTAGRTTVVLRFGAGRGVTGAVVSEDGGAIPGASVHLWRGPSPPDPAELAARSPEARSDDQGAFHIEGVTPGWALQLAVSAPGHVTVLGPVQLDEECTVSLPIACRLGGRVVRSEGEPVPGARVQLLREDGPRTAGVPPQGALEVRTDRAGAFAFEGLSRGHYRPSVESWAGCWRGPAVSVDDDEPVLEIVLRAPASLSVKVVDAAGSALPGACVEVSPPGERDPGLAGVSGAAQSAHLPLSGSTARPSPRLRRTTDSRGRASFFGLGGGPWEVLASAPGHASSEVLALPSAAAADPPCVEVVLSRCGGVQLRVVDYRGDAVPGVHVRLRRTDPMTFALSPGLSDGLGHVAWDDLPPGPYVAVHDPDWVARSLGQARRSLEEPSWVAVEVGEGAQADAVLEMNREAFLTVSVERGGIPVQGATVMLVQRSAFVELAWRGETRLGSARTGPDGAASLPPVLPGAYSLCVRASREACLRTFDVDLDLGHQATRVALEHSLVHGTVLTQGGDPLGEATVRLLPSMFAGMGTGRFAAEDDSTGTPILWAPGEVRVASRGDGTFELADVEAGAYRIEVEAPGHATWSSEELELPGRSTYELEAITLTTSCAVRGMLLGPGAARADAVDFVSLRTEAGRDVGVCVPEDDGSFQFYDLPTGRYQLVARVGDGEVPGDPFEVSLETVTVQDLSLR